MDINNEVNKNKIISEDDSETKNLIEKRIKKYKSKLPESYWSETSWALRTKPPKKRLKTNPGIPLRLSKIVFEKDSENEWSTQHFIEKQKYAGKNKSRRMPCRKCPRCLAPKCRECKMCLNPKFKKPCINRTCFSKFPKDKEKAAEAESAEADDNEDKEKVAEVESDEFDFAEADDDEDKEKVAEVESDEFNFAEADANEDKEKAAEVDNENYQDEIKKNPKPAFFKCKMCLHPKLNKPCINRTCFSKLVEAAEVEKNPKSALFKCKMCINPKLKKPCINQTCFSKLEKAVTEANEVEAVTQLINPKNPTMPVEAVEDDEWSDYINEVKKKKKKSALFDGIDEDDDDDKEDKAEVEAEAEKVKKDKEENSTEKPIASTSTGQRNGYGIPTKPKSKLKNPKPSNKEFKGIACCWQ